MGDSIFLFAHVFNLCVVTLDWIWLVISQCGMNDEGHIMFFRF